MLKRRSLYSEEIERLLHGLSDDSWSIVLWKLQGFTNAEIVATIYGTVRLVELKMQPIPNAGKLNFGSANSLPAACSLQSN